MLGGASNDVTSITPSSQHMMAYFVKSIIPINQVEVPMKA
jgi:hypothetical protein